MHCKRLRPKANGSCGATAIFSGSPPLAATPPMDEQEELRRRFPDLSAPCLAVLALYSFGVIAVRCSGLTTVALFLAKLLGRSVDAVRKRLKEFYLDKEHKSGLPAKRCDFDVTTCFA